MTHEEYLSSELASAKYDLHVALADTGLTFKDADYLIEKLAYAVQHQQVYLVHKLIMPFRD
jgi:hypothetical protein